MLIREYRAVTGATLLAAVAIQLGLGWLPAAPFWVLSAAFGWLFREPRQATAVHPLGVLSPVYGRVNAAGAGHDPYLDRPAVDLRLVAAALGPYIVHCPIEGQVVQVWNRWLDGPRRRAGFAACIRTDEGDEVVLALRGRLPWALQTRFSVGDRLGHGRPCAVMPCGGLARVLVGGHARAATSPGVAVAGGAALIAEILHD